MKGHFFVILQGAGGGIASELISGANGDTAVQVTHIISQALITIFTGYFTYLTYKSSIDNKNKKNDEKGI